MIPNHRLSILSAGVLPNPGTSWHAIGTGDFNGDGKADILWQNTDGTPAIWDMNGMSILSAGVLANPGSTWQLKDDGPISPAQMASGSQPALHLSSPDAANAANNSAQLAGEGASLLDGSSQPTFMRQMFSGAG